MSQNIHRGTASEPMDRVRWVFAVCLWLASMIAFYVLSTAWVRWGCVCVGTALAIGMMSRTTRGRWAWQFCHEARAELRKVIWPSREETVRAALLILGMVLVSGLVLWMVDGLAWRVVAWVTGFGGA